MFDSLLQDLEPFIRDYGALSLFIVLALESVGLPIPGETALIVAGSLSGRGDLPLIAILLAAWAGAVAGDNVGYLVGRFAGKPALLNYGGAVGVTPQRLAGVEAVFVRYGPVTVMFARFVNVLRQLNGLVAGTIGMDWRVFLLCNAIGGALLVLAWGLSAWWLASHIDELSALRQ